MQKVKILVIGCGLSGAVLVERIASQFGEEVLVIDRRDNHFVKKIYAKFDLVQLSS